MKSYSKGHKTIYESSESEYEESDINFVEDTIFTHNISTVIPDNTTSREIKSDSSEDISLTEIISSVNKNKSRYRKLSSKANQSISYVTWDSLENDEDEAVHNFQF